MRGLLPVISVPVLGLLGGVGCSGTRLDTLPVTDRAPLCRQLSTAPTTTFGCSADQVAGFDQPGGRRYAVDLLFGADGRLDHFSDLRPVRDQVADEVAPAPNCLVDELRAWRLTGLKAATTVPVVVTYVAGPTDFRESVLEGPACSVRITFENN